MMSGSGILASILALALASYGAPSPPGRAVGSTAPALPRVQVDTSSVPRAAHVIAVPAGGDLQAALNKAEPGDAITLEAGSVYTGPFVLPRKAGDGWIVLRSSAEDKLPKPGTRVGPGDAAAMPKLISRGDDVITTAPGAHHFRFVGIEFRPAAGVFLYNLVHLGAKVSSVDELPHHFVFDRCFLHGDNELGTRRGILLNAGETAVIDSYLSDFKEGGSDSQALGGSTGPGPYKISNNYLEAAGENVMFGGADPPFPDLVPSDIEITSNHIAKPLTWMESDPSYAGKKWSVKNLLELKNARRVLIDGNLLEYNWPSSQNGFAILFTVRNQDGKAPWSVVEDVTFTNNVVRHVSSAINILGQDDIHESRQARRILIANNLFEDVGGETWKGKGRFLQLLAVTTSVVVEHNTVTQTGDILGVAGGPHSEFVFRHNVAKHNQYGMIGDGTNNPVTTLKQYFPGAVVRSNLFLGGTPNAYPEGNSFRKEERESADADSAPGADEERLNAALDAGGRHPAP